MVGAGPAPRRPRSAQAFRSRRPCGRRPRFVTDAQGSRGRRRGDCSTKLSPKAGRCRAPGIRTRCRRRRSTAARGRRREARRSCSPARAPVRRHGRDLARVGAEAPARWAPRRRRHDAAARHAVVFPARLPRRRRAAAGATRRCARPSGPSRPSARSRGDRLASSRCFGVAARRLRRPQLRRADRALRGGRIDLTTCCTRRPPPRRADGRGAARSPARCPPSPRRCRRGRRRASATRCWAWSRTTTRPAQTVISGDARTPSQRGRGALDAAGCAASARRRDRVPLPVVAPPCGALRGAPRPLSSSAPALPVFSQPRRPRPIPTMPSAAPSREHLARPVRSSRCRGDVRRRRAHLRRGRPGAVPHRPRRRDLAGRPPRSPPTAAARRAGAPGASAARPRWDSPVQFARSGPARDLPPVEMAGTRSALPIQRLRTRQAVRARVDTRPSRAESAPEEAAVSMTPRSLPPTPTRAPVQPGASHAPDVVAPRATGARAPASRAAWVRAFVESQRQTADVHDLPQAMADAHRAFLKPPRRHPRADEPAEGRAAARCRRASPPAARPPRWRAAPPAPGPVPAPVQSRQVRWRPRAGPRRPAELDAAAPKPAAGAGGRHQALLLTVVAEKTGYPAEMLKPEMGLDADLGIDSIKRVEILSAAAGAAPGAPGPRPKHLGTLRRSARSSAFLGRRPRRPRRAATRAACGRRRRAAKSAPRRPRASRRCCWTSWPRRPATRPRCSASTWTSTPTSASTRSSASRSSPPCGSRRRERPGGRARAPRHAQDPRRDRRHAR